MKQIILLILILPVISGCGLFDRKLTTDVITSNVPVIFSPRPPVIARPELVLRNLTEEQRNNPGELAKHYKATIVQLLGYIEELEKSLEEYEKISDEVEASGIDIP